MDWREDRNHRLTKAKRVLIKVGSAVLTGGEGLDAGVVSSLAAQMAALHARGVDIVLVSSGAVAAGRRALTGKAKIDALPSKQAAAAVGQSRLMRAWDEAFGAHGVVTAQLLLTRDDLESRERYLNIRNTLRTLREWRAIPIVNENDTVAVHELVYGDNDCLASLLSPAVEAELAVNLTSAAGVFAAYPAPGGAACLAHVPDIDSLDLNAMCGAKTSAGSGGMYSKLAAAKRVAKLSVPTLILPGREKDSLVRAFAGQDVGTWIAAHEQAVSRRKFWLAFATAPRGALTVDAGAARALADHGKSLLPAGVTNVTGQFEAGDPVSIDGPGGERLGVGLANYRSADMARIMGRKSAAIEKILGMAPYPEAVHRDNMSIGADV
ncbi:MAG: glutamate 5-kinase [Desulfovibrionaceae bacterium]|nr:glutamate 5-kinase [Desulfovibrionaceae bacterium]MBF0513913.1 glutamate 5-kinase [Desulfovibrionaceae bacterium]